jgi:hypothetical protein
MSAEPSVDKLRTAPFDKLKTAPFDKLKTAPFDKLKMALLEVHPSTGSGCRWAVRVQVG